MPDQPPETTGAAPGEANRPDASSEGGARRPSGFWMQTGRAPKDGAQASVPARRTAPRPDARPGRWRRLTLRLLLWMMAGAVGFAALSAAAVFVIGWTGPPPTLNMAIAASGGADVRRTWAPLTRISPHLIRAVIAAEDQRFCAHQGFDAVEIQKALDEAERGRRLRGASTLSQQTAKNVFLWNGGGFVRKGFEAWFTLLVEQMWSKPRIIEIYLNVAEWGEGAYGAEAAARLHFNKPASRLTQREAALLAAVLPSPNRWSVDGRYAQRRAGQIQTLMRVIRRDGLDACVIR